MKSMTAESILNLIKEKGVLRYSTLMVRYHISSVEAQNIVNKYIADGIVDSDGRYGKKSENSWKRFSPRTLSDLEEESSAAADDESYKENDNLVTTSKDSDTVRKEETSIEKAGDDKGNQLKQEINGQLSLF